MFKRILAAIDDSDTAALVLAHATELARAHGARLLLVHVVDELTARVAAAPTPEAFWKAARREGERILERARTDAEKAGVKAELRLLEIRTFGSLVRRIPTVIVAEAERWPADLVVIGTHGRRGLSKALLGSVADGVVRSASVPVLLVRSAPARRRAR